MHFLRNKNHMALWNIDQFDWQATSVWATINMKVLYGTKKMEKKRRIINLTIVHSALVFILLD